MATSTESPRSGIVRAAVIQAAPILFDTAKTLQKLADLSADATKQGAELVVFPEALIGGYPKGHDFGVSVGIRSPEGREEFRRLFESAIDVPGPATEFIGSVAKDHAIHLVVGVVEREGGTLYCTALSLSFGANYKAAYCLSACPAGEDVIGPYLTDKAAHLREIVRPLQEKQETVYVVPGSDAEEHVARRFPLKTIKRVGSGLRPRTIQRFLSGLPLVFQPGKAAKLKAVFHFTFTGKEPKEATVTIREGTLQVQDGHHGEADLRVTADSETWLGFLAKERSLLWALLRRRIRIKGSPKLLVAFGKCFPS